MCGIIGYTGHQDAAPVPFDPPILGEGSACHDGPLVQNRKPHSNNT